MVPTNYHIRKRSFSGSPITTQYIKKTADLITTLKFTPPISTHISKVQPWIGEIRVKFKTP